MSRVWVTRDEPHDGPLCRALQEAGLVAVCEPVLGRTRTSDARDELRALGGRDWLVLTSAYAVAGLAELPRPSPRIAAVGASTARAIRDRGWHLTLETSSTSEALWRELREQATEGTLCYPRSSLAEPPPAWAEVNVTSPIVYEVSSREYDRAVIERVDWISVTSPSAVKAIGPRDKPWASIGPTTTAALRDISITPRAEAAAPTFDELARAIVSAERHASGET